MKSSGLIAAGCGLAGLMLSGCAKEKAPEWKRSPNVIYILADDLGIGDISPYGQKLIWQGGSEEA